MTFNRLKNFHDESEFDNSIRGNVYFSNFWFLDGSKIGELPKIKFKYVLKSLRNSQNETISKISSCVFNHLVFAAVEWSIAISTG